MPMADEKYEVAAEQGLKEAFAGISENIQLIKDIKAAVLSKVANLDNILTGPEQTAFTNLQNDLDAIETGSVFTVINGKDNHPSHGWRNILEL